MQLMLFALKFVSMHAGALEACGMSSDVAQLVAGAQQATGLEHMTQCMVCFEDVQPLQLSVQLPCGHCTCDTCWQVQHAMSNSRIDWPQIVWQLSCAVLSTSPQTVSYLSGSCGVTAQKHHDCTDPQHSPYLSVASTVTHVFPTCCLTGCQSCAALSILAVDRIPTCLPATTAGINTGL